MTVDRLYEGYQYIKKNYFSTSRILDRFPANYRNPLIFLLANAGLKYSINTENKVITKTIDKLHNMIEENYKQNIVNFNI